MRRRWARPDVSGWRLFRWVLTVAVLAVGLAFIVQGANRPADPTLEPVRRVPLEGFGEIAFRIAQPGARLTVEDWKCALLADTPQQQSQGLMRQHHLSGYDGMLFRFPTDTSTSFYMKDTPLPLSIAWYDAEGRFVSSADMDPCLNAPECPTYSAKGPYRFALEVERGDLLNLGARPGSRLELGDRCP